MAKQKTKDEIVDELIEIVTKKKAEIAKAEKPKWETNCSYTLNGERINIQTVSNLSVLVDIATDLVIWRDAQGVASKLLNIICPSKKNGFSFNEWMADLKTKADKLEISKRKAELEDAEERLNKLISPEKREQMELVALQKLLSK